MKTSPDASLLIIRQQIARLEQEYQFALQQDKDFAQLKQIKIQLKHLEERFREMISSR